MNESINHVEYVVEQKPEGKNLTLRILLIAGYILFGLAYFIFFTVKLKIVMLISLLPVFIWMLVFFTWRFAAVEHEYQIVSGTVIFSDIYGNRTRKKKFEYKIKDMLCIAPMDRTHESDYTKSTLTHDFRGSAKSPDSYYFTYKDSADKTCVVYFEATARTLKSFRYYNSAATVMSTSLRY
jgi:hypothetical protein